MQNHSSDAVPVEERTDEELFLDIQNGSQEALGKLYERYAPIIVSYGTRYTGDSHLAEDVLQETFLRLPQITNLFDSQKKVKPWLHTVARNVLLDILRKQSRRPPMNSQQGHEGLTEEHEEKVSGYLFSREPDPAQYILEQESRSWERAQLLNAISRLPAHLREVIRLTCEGLMQPEIADQIGIPRGTVKSRFFAARALLRQAMRDTSHL